MKNLSKTRSMTTPVIHIFEHPNYQSKTAETTIPSLAVILSILVWLSILSLTMA